MKLVILLSIVLCLRSASSHSFANFPRPLPASAGAARSLQELPVFGLNVHEYEHARSHHENTSSAYFEAGSSQNSTSAPHATRASC